MDEELRHIGSAEELADSYKQQACENIQALIRSLNALEAEGCTESPMLNGIRDAVIHYATCAVAATLGYDLTAIVAREYTEPDKAIATAIRYIQQHIGEMRERSEQIIQKLHQRVVLDELLEPTTMETVEKLLQNLESFKIDEE